MTVPVPYRARIQRYNATAMVLHWLVAALILVAVLAGLPAANSKGAEAQRLVDTHKAVGLTLLGLVVLRILWRMVHKPPPLPGAYSRPSSFPHTPPTSSSTQSFSRCR